MSSSSSLSEHISEMGKAMLVAGLALLVATVVLLASAEHDLRVSNTEVQRANAALLKLADVNALVIGVDFSARGYALTGEPLFLDHEYQKQHEIKLALADLMRFTDPEQAAGVARLSQLIDRHAAVYAKFVAMGPGHAKEMAALITDQAERRKRYDVLDVVAKLRGDVMADLVEHQATAERQQRYAMILTIVIVATAFLGNIMNAIVRVFSHRRFTHAQHKTA